MEKLLKFSWSKFDYHLSRSLHTLFYPAIIGFLSFLTVIGYSRLRTDNIGWISHTNNPDTLQQYIGWEMFRDSKWSFPPGVNSGILNGDSSIVYTGGIPLLELPLKLVEAWLGDPFQYLGIWLLICFVLQAISAQYLLTRIPGISQYEKLIFSTAFCFSPILLWRVNLHLGLAAHFLIIFALGLCLDAKLRLRRFSWSCLLTSSLLIHGYFFIMTAVLASAAIISNSLSTKETRKIVYVLRQFIQIFACPLLTAYLVGYFASSSGWNTGFPNHLFKMDLSQPFNITGQSWILSEIFPATTGNPEGFNFLGVWVFLGLLFILVKRRDSFAILSKSLSNNGLLVGVLIVMFLYALTNHISLLRFQFVIPLPGKLEDLFEVFRASGRFFWPMFYAIYLVTIAMLVKNLKGSIKGVVFLLLILFHIGDSNYYWRSINDINNKKFVGQIDVSPRLESLIKLGEYSEIVYVPIFADDGKVQECFAWRSIGLLSAQYGLSTNCTFLARYDAIDTKKFGDRVKSELESGSLNPKRIYILGKESVNLSYRNPCVVLTRFENIPLVFPSSDCKK